MPLLQLQQDHAMQILDHPETGCWVTLGSLNRNNRTQCDMMLHNSAHCVEQLVVPLWSELLPHCLLLLLSPCRVLLRRLLSCHCCTLPLNTLQALPPEESCAARGAAAAMMS